jgi:hypothetical protein
MAHRCCSCEVARTAISTPSRSWGGFASPFRFHLDRNAGITPAAYIVISIVGGTSVIEECGDRDVTGVRVGALLQALIAREPAESRPHIRGWLPPGFQPPQINITATPATPPFLLARALSSRLQGLHWSAGDVLYRLNDVF